MKKTIIVFSLLALFAPVFGQTITVTSPKEEDSWRTGTEHAIAWTKSGAMQATVAIRLRAAGSLESDPATLAIADGTANDGYFSWKVPGSVAPGSYFIRVRTVDSSVTGDSATFKIVRLYTVLSSSMTAHYNPPAIHSSGTMTVLHEYLCDLDEGTTYPTSPSNTCDFWWSKNSIAPYQRVLIPDGSAKFKTLGVWFEYTKSKLISAHPNFSSTPIVEAYLPINMVVGYITDQGRLGAFRVTAMGSNDSLAITWTTYEIGN